MFADMLPPLTPRSVGRLPSTLLLSLLAVSSYLTPATAAIEVEHDAQAPILAVVPPSVIPGDDPGPVLPHKPTTLDFRLRHIFHHGTWRYPTLHRRLDVPDDAQVWMAAGDDVADKEIAPPLRARSDTIKMQRLADRRRETINSMLDVGRMTGQAVALDSSAWIVDELSGPNVTDKETVLSFARMAANAYILEPGTGEWKGVGGGFNYTEDFGWESDGLRGHIFADTKNQTVVIGLKGTSAAVFDGSETTTNDKINDNLFFGCCCGQGGQYLWKQVCDCQTSAYTCNSTCLVQALRNKNRYYYAVQDLYHNVTDLYPTADIWVTGHSLGGATVSLLGLTYGLPTVTFEAPGEAMAAARLALPTPPGYDLGMHQQRDMTGGFHFGHTADPIFMGICNTASSFCTIAGYAMQSQCHTGKTCTYDTVEDKGWRVGIGTHRINQVIKDVIQDYDEPAACKPMYNCTDCYPWEFYESNGTDTTTSSRSSTSTTTRTRTQTCKTPGWWGCLDESSTTTTTTTSTTSTSTSTSTCKTPGWFGCKDETTTTTTSTSSSASSHTAQPAPAPTVTTTSSHPTATSSPPSSSSTTCHHPGWFGGCNDPTSTSSRPSTQPPKSSSSSSTTSCKSREWFGLICVDPSPTSAAMSSPRPTASKTPVSKGKCRRRNWFGWCVDWAEYKLDL